MTDRSLRLTVLAIRATLAMAAGIHVASIAAPNAQGTWRCANNTYTDQPCAEGKSIDPADARSEADRRAADAATRRARRGADTQEKERLKREERASREGRPAVFARPAAELVADKPAARRTKKKKGAKETEFFTAHGSQPGEASRKR